MKILLILIIMIISFLVGYSYKKRIQNELDFLKYMKNFAEYLKSNINLFKNDVVEIIDEFKISCNSKILKFNQIFIKNEYIYHFSLENIENYLSEKETSFIIFNFLKSIGTNEYEFEGERINSFIFYIDSKISDYVKKVKEEGDLFFKIALSIGAIISILVW